MSHAVVRSTGAVAQLDAKPSQTEAVTPEDVQKPPRLSELLGRLVTAVSELRRAWAPKTIDFEDVSLGAGGASTRLEHGFGGRVRWWLVDWQPTATGNRPNVERSSSSTNDVLVLLSSQAGTATVRVEQAG